MVSIKNLRKGHTCYMKAGYCRGYSKLKVTEVDQANQRVAYTVRHFGKDETSYVTFEFVELNWITAAERQAIREQEKA